MGLATAIINVSTPVSLSLIGLFTAWYSEHSKRSPSVVFLSSFVTFHCLRALLASNAKSRQKKEDAQRLGGRIIPKVKGKWPGNFDVLMEMVRSESEGYPGEIFARWCEEYGPTFDMGILWGSQMVTADPEVIKQIMSTQFNSFEKGTKWNKMSYDFLGDGIFSTDGATWKHHRAVARPFFAQDRISDFECFKRHADTLIGVLDTQMTTGKAFDLQDLFRHLTLDITTDFLFGTPVNSLQTYLDSTANEHADFSKAFDQISNILATRVRLGASWYPYYEFRGNKMKGPKAIIDKFVDPIVKHARERYENSRNMDAHSQSESYTFIDHLFKTSGDESTSGNYVKDELLNFLLAGRDTTASTLTFLTYALTVHPECRKQLQEEINAIVGDSTDIGPEQLKKMRYLRACIDETLRVFSPVPFNIRRSIGATILTTSSGPLYMPPRVSITYAPLLMHRSISKWGDSAEIFNPARWLSDSGPESNTRRENFAPFNGGPRLCLGQQFAYTAVSYIIVRMLQRCTLSLAPESQPEGSVPPLSWTQTARYIQRKAVEKIWPRASLTLYVKDGFWVKAHGDQKSL